MTLTTVRFTAGEVTDGTASGASGDNQLTAGGLLFTITASGNWTANFDNERFNFTEDASVGGQPFTIRISKDQAATFTYTDFQVSYNATPGIVTDSQGTQWTPYLSIGPISNLADNLYSGGPVTLQGMFPGMSIGPVQYLELGDHAISFIPGSPNPTSTLWIDNITADVNINPTISDFNATDGRPFYEGSNPLLIDGSPYATVGDADSTGWNGGNLTFRISSGRVNSEDVLSIQNLGTGAGQIGVSGANVTYGGTTIGTFTGGTGSANLVITFNANATNAAIQALIGRLAYQNTNLTDPHVGNRSVSLILTDGGLASFTTPSATISVVGVNDAPTLALTGLTPTFTENGSAVDLFSNVSVSTVEAGQNITAMTLEVQNASSGSDMLVIDGSQVVLTQGNLVDTASGLTILVTFSGTTALVSMSTTAGISVSTAQTVIDGISFQNTSDRPSALNRVITFNTIIDSGGTLYGGSNRADPFVSSTVTVVQTNDAPVATVPAGPLQAVEQTSLSLKGTGLSVADADAGSASVTVTLSVGEGSLFVVVGTSGVTTSSTYSSSVTLTGTIAQINSLLGAGGASGLFYNSDTNSPSASTVLTMTVNDGGNSGPGGPLSHTGTTTINITPVNDAPTLTATELAPTFTEGGAGANLFSNVSISAVEPDQAILKVTLTVDNVTDGASEILQIDGNSFGLADGIGFTVHLDLSVNVVNGTATIVLLAPGGLSSSDFANIINQITYRNTSENPTAGDRTVTITSITDLGGTANGGIDTTVISVGSVVSVVAVNDAPVVTMPVAALQAVEQTSLSLKGTGLAVADADAGSASVTVTLSVAEGSLIATVGNSGASITNNGTSSLTITGTVAQINALLASGGTSELHYLNNSDTPSASTALTLTVSDNGNSGPGGALTHTGTTTINITPVNDAPTAAFANPFVAFEATEQVALSLKTGEMSVSDVDGGNATVKLTVAEGLLNATAGDSGVVLSGSGTQQLIITGSITQINAFLGVSGTSTLTYFNASDNPSPAVNLSFEVGDGNILYQVGKSISIAPVDDPAVAANDAFTTTENTHATGSVFAPPGEDVDPDNALVVTAVNGQTVSVGQLITLASGARLMLNANGQFDYDPNHAFDHLPDFATSGASNTTATDSFTYTIAGGSTATVTITVHGADSNDTVTGTNGIDVLSGGIGNDHIDGLLGADIMTGGAGDDTYVVDDALDVVDELALGSGGNDTISGGMDLSLVNNPQILGDVENITLLGTLGYTATGNAADNILTGNSGGNRLVGGAGDDTMRGGAGWDVYVVDSALDTIDESLAGSDGRDTVQTSVSLSLLNNPRILGDVENVSLLGTADLTATGNTLDNYIWGNVGANRIDGGAGADIMYGRGGNDVYVVDNTSDIVHEGEGVSSGTDTVQSSISFSLANTSRVIGVVENLSLLGGADINGTGNALDNIIWGSAGANILDGGLGNDIMRGRAGNDIYIIDSLLDTIDESDVGSNGQDTVQSYISFSLTNNARVLGVVEDISLLGSANVNATGSSISNVLYGNTGDNILNGMAGADIMRGRGGNDIYVVDDAGDIVDESFAGSDGNDAVQSSISFSLSNGARVLGDVETLSLIGTSAINGTGNALNNFLYGNVASNILTGGAGFDTFVFHTALNAVTNVDTITDFSVADDTIRLENAVFTALTTLGTLASGAFFVGSAAHDADDRIIYNATTGALSYDFNGNLAGGGVKFAQLSAGLALTNLDFQVI